MTASLTYTVLSFLLGVSKQNMTHAVLSEHSRLAHTRLGIIRGLRQTFMHPAPLDSYEWTYDYYSAVPYDNAWHQRICHVHENECIISV